MTPIALTSFFEDGTMAQLWSLPWVVLFFERLAARSIKGMALTFFLATFSHPITGLIILITIILTSPLLWIGREYLDTKEKMLRNTYSYGAGIAIIGALVIFASRYSIFSLGFQPESSKYIPELFHGFFLPWTIASIYGWYILLNTHKKNVVLIYSLASFFFVSLLVGSNNQLGIGFWTSRLNVYATICIIVGGSIGFTHLLGSLRPKWLIAPFAATLLISLTGSIVYDNQNIYKRNESETVTTRINKHELQAIVWLKENAPLSARVISSAETRHYEWVPVLSGLSWNSETPNPYTLRIFFTRREKVPEYILQQPERYRLEYENKGAAIFHMISL